MAVLTLSRISLHWLDLDVWPWMQTRRRHSGWMEQSKSSMAKDHCVAMEAPCRSHSSCPKKTTLTSQHIRPVRVSAAQWRCKRIKKWTSPISSLSRKFHRHPLTETIITTLSMRVSRPKLQATSGVYLTKEASRRAITAIYSRSQPHLSTSSAALKKMTWSLQLVANRENHPHPAASLSSHSLR